MAAVKQQRDLFTVDNGILRSLPDILVGSLVFLWAGSRILVWADPVDPKGMLPSMVLFLLQEERAVWRKDDRQAARAPLLPLIPIKV